jgi:hypothetical protein
MKIVFSFWLLWIVQVAVAQQVIYRNEMGGLISREVFEDKITNGPYFGVPGANPNEKALLHRMPFGKVEPQVFYEALGMEDALKARKSLIIIYYPGKDECNSTGSQANDASRFRKNHEYLLKGASKKAAEAPFFIYKNPHGLEKYEGIMDWIPDPEGIFEKNFFKYPYPCRSFVVIHPSGEYRSILGEFPESQVMLALKILNK